ncbi:MAG: serine/threonine protein phosphatase [Bacteroidales bacterium]|nr:serine/threonine protein phosphatase [Bacteroidales bacterium]
MEKIWVIPDTHGCSETLKTLIFQQINPDKKDHLVFLGDYIDRGPDSKGVLDFIMNLEEQGYHVAALTGNHESICIKAFEESQKLKHQTGYKHLGRYQQHWSGLGGIQTLKSFQVEEPSDIPEEYIDWMRSRDYYLELDDFFAVHAGFNFDIEDPLSDTESMIWIRNFITKHEMIKGKRIVHGHNPSTIETIKENIEDKHALSINLDNGIYLTGFPGYGNLVSLELNTLEYKIQKVVDKVNYFPD